jgi:hypothetical protein
VFRGLKLLTLTHQTEAFHHEIVIEISVRVVDVAVEA